MTREEAIRALRYERKTALHENKSAFDMAIKSLSAEPCEDCISRQAVINGVDNYIEKAQSTSVIDDFISFEELVVKALPPVTPIQKMGRWIMPVQDDGMSDPIYYQVRCSECGFYLDPQTWHMELHQYSADKYCPNCGAKMQEVDE